MGILDDLERDLREGNYQVRTPATSAIGFGLQAFETASGVNLVSEETGLDGVSGRDVNYAYDVSEEVRRSLGAGEPGGSGPPGVPNIPSFGEIRQLLQLGFLGLLALVVIWTLGQLFEFQFVIGDGE
jgi:hypothetical protein